MLQAPAPCRAPRCWAVLSGRRLSRAVSAARRRDDVVVVVEKIRSRCYVQKQRGVEHHQACRGHWGGRESSAVSGKKEAGGGGSTTKYLEASPPALLCDLGVAPEPSLAPLWRRAVGKYFLNQLLPPPPKNNNAKKGPVCAQAVPRSPGGAARREAELGWGGSSAGSSSEPNSSATSIPLQRPLLHPWGPPGGWGARGGGDLVGWSTQQTGQEEIRRRQEPPVTCH